MSLNDIARKFILARAFGVGRLLRKMKDRQVFGLTPI